MQGSRLLWQGVIMTRKRPSRSIPCNVYTGTRLYSQSSTTAHNADENDAQQRLEKIQDDLKSDPNIKILASPLRRCASTQLVLPTSMLFRLTSHRQWPENATEENILLDRFPLSKVPKEPPNALLRRRTRRWLLKEAKRQQQKRLLRSQRMMQHKVVTSITDKSRQHFSEQLTLVKEQLKALLRPLSPGNLLPFGLTRSSINQSRGIARGKGLWVTLNKKIVADVGQRKLHKLRPSTLPTPSNLPDLLQEGLEQRVVEEAQHLLQRLTGEPRSICNRNGWLIRRTKGQETRGMLQDGLLKLRDGNGVLLACLVLTSGKMPTLQHNVDSYDLQILFQDESRKKVLIDTLRKIAILLNTKQERERKAGKIVQSKKGQTTCIPVEDEMTTIQMANTSEQGVRWPRILVVKRDERTVELCISLWRLQSWCRSDNQSSIKSIT